MVFIMTPGASQREIDAFAANFECKGFSTIVSRGTEHTAVCLIGNTAVVDMEHIIETSDIVQYGRRVTEQYKAVNRVVHPDNTVVKCGQTHIGPDNFTVIAGPCSVESEEQINKVAAAVKKSGAAILRGGAFKPRSSPYSFQGLGEEGLKMLIAAGKQVGLPVISEVMNQTQLPLFEDVDILQVGARNMQNFDLLKEVGKMNKPVLLKRGLSNTIDELLMSAEYIMTSGSENVILCERGIRTFETSTRNTLDIAAVVALKQKTHLPVIIDPSHASGMRSFVMPLAKAALAVGADGVMIETHNNPAEALCDGAQSLDLREFDELMKQLKKRITLENRVIE